MCFEVFRCVKDTGRIVHVGLRCVEVRVCAEQFRNQRQHQRWVTGTQKLQTPERERKDKTVIRSSMDGFCEDKTQDTRQDNTFRTVIVWCHSHWTLQLACLNILFLDAGLHKNYRTEQISLDGWRISAQNRPNWLLVLIQINKERSRSYFSLSLKLWDQMFFFTLVPSLRHPRFCCIHFGNPKLKFYSSTWSSQKVLSQKIISHTHRARESLTSRQSCDRSDICWGSSAAPAEPAGCTL